MCTYTCASPPPLHALTHAPQYSGVGVGVCVAGDGRDDQQESLPIHVFKQESLSAAWMPLRCACACFCATQDTHTIHTPHTEATPKTWRMRRTSPLLRDYYDVYSRPSFLSSTIRHARPCRVTPRHTQRIAHNAYPPLTLLSLYLNTLVCAVSCTLERESERERAREKDTSGVRCVRVCVCAC